MQKNRYILKIITLVNMLFNGKEVLCTAHRSGRNGKCSKQANLLMIVEGETKHYTAITNTSRLLKHFNATHKEAYHFCMNCLNGFHKVSARDKHCEHCSSNGHVKYLQRKKNA